MLKIREEQFRAFAESVREQLIRDLIRHSWTFFPERCRELRDELEREIRCIVDDAVHCGFDVPRTIGKFLNLAFLLGRGFHDRDWVAAILIDTTCESPDERLARIRLLSAGR